MKNIVLYKEFVFGKLKPLTRIVLLSLICAFSAMLVSCEADKDNSFKPIMNKSDDASLSEAAGSDDVISELSKYAENAVSDMDAEEGDILIAYNLDTFEACCFTVENGNAVLMYEGDYQGIYSRLEYIDEKEYGSWSIMIYRINENAKVDEPTDEINELASSILKEYSVQYGEPKTGAVVYIIDAEGHEYQYITEANGSLTLMEYDHIEYDKWRNSDDAENYWAKYVCEETEDGGAWALYERDELCSEAFLDISDTYNAIIDAGDEVKNGTVFLWEKGDNKIAMRNVDGGMYYVHIVDFEEMRDDMQLYNTDHIDGTHDTVSLYVVK